MMLLNALTGAPANDADALARKMGFPSAAAMQAYHQREVQRITGRSQAGSGASSMPSSVSDAANQGLSIHPAHLLQYILDRWNAATGGK